MQLNNIASIDIRHLQVLLPLLLLLLLLLLLSLLSLFQFLLLVNFVFADISAQ